MSSDNPNQALVIAFVVWLLALIVSVVLLTVARCPRCGECFHTEGFRLRAVRSCCHCKLHLTTDKRS